MVVEVAEVPSSREHFCPVKLGDRRGLLLPRLQVKAVTEEEVASQPLGVEDHVMTSGGAYGVDFHSFVLHHLKTLGWHCCMVEKEDLALPLAFGAGVAAAP